MCMGVLPTCLFTSAETVAHTCLCSWPKIDWKTRRRLNRVAHSFNPSTWHMDLCELQANRATKWAPMKIKQSNRWNRTYPNPGEVEKGLSLGLGDKSGSSRFNDRFCLKRKGREWLRKTLLASTWTCIYVCTLTPIHKHTHAHTLE